MAVNLLSVNQASFETDLTGWEVEGRPVPQNMLTANQASFENGVISASDWAARGAPTSILEASTARARVGEWSMAVTRNPTGFVPGPLVVVSPATATLLPIVEGETYTAMVSGWAEDAHVLGLRLEFHNASGAVDTSQVRQLDTIGGQWTDHRATWEAPIGATYARLELSMLGTPFELGEYAYFDRIGLFHGEADEWSLPGAVGQTAERVALAQAPHGNHVLALTRHVERGVVEAQTTTVAAVEFATYTAMADLRLPEDRLGGVHLDMLDADGGVLTSAQAVVTGTGAGWVTARVTDVSPVGTASARLRVFSTDLLPDETIEIDKTGLFDGYAVAWAPGGQAAPALFQVLLDPNRHRVAVTLLGLDGIEPVYVERILPDGRTELVRNAQGLEPAGGGVFFDDYDTPTDAGFRYQATQGGVVVATSDVVTLPSNGHFFLMDPNLPMSALPVIPAANAIPEWQRTAPVGVYRVLGRQDPIVVTDVRWWAEGEFTCYTLTRTQRDAFGQLSSRGLTVGLYGPADVLGGIGRIYLVGSQVSERRVSPRGTEQAREWHVQVTQVAQPTQVPRTTPIVIWQDVVNAYDTWLEVVDNETDWIDVMTGVPGAGGVATEVGWEW